jgi:predicted signal transduction protein with EAL and GGDEF domain
MTTLTNFMTKEFKNTKQFTKAVQSVMSGIASRNEQVQQLLIVATQEATKSNNLTWLSNVLAVANETKGINATKIALYVKEVLCKSTVAWDRKDQKLTKSKLVDKLDYDVQPASTWYEYGGKDKVEKAFDRAKDITSRINSALAVDKGNLDTAVVVNAILSSNLTIEDILKAIEVDQAA